jgi:hypothetical protein
MEFGAGQPSGQKDGCNDAKLDGLLIDTTDTGQADDGAIYLGRNWAGLGNQILNTTIQNISPYKGQGSGHLVFGIYIDDLQAGTMVRHCTFSNVNCGILMGGGWGNTIDDVHFVSKASGFYSTILIDDRGRSWALNNLQGTPDVPQNGAAFGTVVQWMPWGGPEPAGWSAAYDNLDGQGHGLASWMALYKPGSGVTGQYGEPLWDTISKVTYDKSHGDHGFVDANKFVKTASPAWTFGNGVTISGDATQSDTGGAPPFTGRTSRLAAPLG